MEKFVQKNLPPFENLAEEEPEVTPASLHILISLGDGPKHGYGIMKDIADFTHNEMTIGPGTTYRTLRQLTETGIISKIHSENSNEKRKINYTLTDKGVEIVIAEVGKMKATVDVARKKGFQVD